LGISDWLLPGLEPNPPRAGSDQETQHQSDQHSQGVLERATLPTCSNWLRVLPPLCASPVGLQAEWPKKSVRMQLTGRGVLGKTNLVNCQRTSAVCDGRDQHIELMKRITSILLSVAFLVGCNSFAKDAPKANPFSKVLAAIPAAELPAKAADLVSQAKPAQRSETTVNVVKAALGINPAAAPAIIGAIARAVPEMSSIAAGTAAGEQPRQAAAIAKAAAAAAPMQAGAIAEAVCRVVPREYRSIAVAVSQAAPDANKEIVNAVAAALPDFKPFVQKVVAGYGGNVVSVGGTLDQAAIVAQSRPAAETAFSPAMPRAGTPTVLVGAPLARGPAVGPPYVALTVTPTNVTSGTSAPVPPDGRNYAAP
jgi:hypothetical protein